MDSLSLTLLYIILPENEDVIVFQRNRRDQIRDAPRSVSKMYDNDPVFTSYDLHGLRFFISFVYQKI